MHQYLSSLYLLISEVNTDPNSSLDATGQKPSQLIKFICAAAYLTMCRWLWVNTHPY